MLNISRLLSLATVALLAGSYFSGAYVLVPAQRQLSASSYVEVEQVNTRLGTVRFRILVFATMLLQAALMIQLQPKAGAEFYWTALALTLVVLATVVTVRFVVPINATVHTWNYLSPPSNWQDFRQKWGQYHLVRTVLVCMALVAQLLAYFPQTSNR